jgi:DNA-binding CsgD family transcriptional regulator
VTRGDRAALLFAQGISTGRYLIVRVPRRQVKKPTPCRWRVASGKMLLYLKTNLKMFTVKNILLYAAAMAAIILLLQWMQVKLLVIDHATEIYMTGIAVVFTLLGIWLAKKLTRPKTEVIKESVVIEKEVIVYRPAPESFLPDTEMIGRLGISQREMDVLERMAGGATNQEIADQLFVSLNTIKTHISRLFEKLDVKRRTQAIEKAKRLHIIP